MKDLASHEAPLAAQIARIPFAILLGIELIASDRDRIEAKLVVRPELCNPMGVLHGGAAISIADTLGAMLAFRNLPEGAGGTTTLESKTNFLGPAKSGETVMAVTTAVHVGRRTSVWQTRITTEAGKPVALVTQTQMTL
ncbi:MAG: hotdog fold thioesterase [Alphaproteobacteria bacterium]|nr:hotdog fold thioesterase [Alphaproteobacteria bacterium]